MVADDHGGHGPIPDEQVPVIPPELLLGPQPEIGWNLVEVRKHVSAGDDPIGSVLIYQRRSILESIPVKIREGQDPHGLGPLG